MNTKELAIKKLEEEMRKDKPESEKLIFEWLQKQEDEDLFKGVLQEEKSVKNAYQYAYSQASKMAVGSCAIVTHETVFQWVVDYFKKSVMVAEKGKLEMEFNNKVLKMNQKATMNNQIKSKKIDKNQEISVKQKTKMMEGEQLDLLDFL